MLVKKVFIKERRFKKIQSTTDQKEIRLFQPTGIPKGRKGYEEENVLLVPIYSTGWLKLSLTISGGGTLSKHLNSPPYNTENDNYYLFDG